MNKKVFEKKKLFIEYAFAFLGFFLRIKYNCIMDYLEYEKLVLKQIYQLKLSRPDIHLQDAINFFRQKFLIILELSAKHHDLELNTILKNLINHPYHPNNVEKLVKQVFK